MPVASGDTDLLPGQEERPDQKCRGTQADSSRSMRQEGKLLGPRAYGLECDEGDGTADPDPRPIQVDTEDPGRAGRPTGEDGGPDRERQAPPLPGFTLQPARTED